MAKTGIFHHIGTFLLFASAILLLITTISAPVVHDIGMLKVTLTNRSSIRNSSVTFGTFGHCVLDVATADNSDADWCTGVHIGYNPANIMSVIDQTSFNTASEDTSKALTRVMVLHPVACGLAFIAFLLALGAGFVGALFAASVAVLSWIVTVVVLACDFTLFGIIRNHVNSNKDSSGSHAKFGVGIWTELAAMILLLFATLLVLLTCCSSRMHKQNKNSKVMDAGYGAGTTTTHKRRFWQRRSRY